MKHPLKVLVAEDNPQDAELMVRPLAAAGLKLRWERVDSEAAYLDRLNGGFDLVLSDYHMPEFSGLRARELLKKTGLEIPFIIVSGAIGEELAVEAMKLGASDYLLKDRLGRLVPAVTQALAQHRMRDERQATERAAARAEAKYRTLFENSVEGLYQTTPAGRLLFANPALAQIAGYGSRRTCGR